MCIPYAIIAITIAVCCCEFGHERNACGVSIVILKEVISIEYILISCESFSSEKEEVCF